MLSLSVKMLKENSNFRERFGSLRRLLQLMKYLMFPRYKLNFIIFLSEFASLFPLWRKTWIWIFIQNFDWTADKLISIKNYRILENLIKNDKYFGL